MVMYWFTASKSMSDLMKNSAHKSEMRGLALQCSGLSCCLQSPILYGQ